MYPLPFPEPYWFRKLWVPSFADSGLPRGFAPARRLPQSLWALPRAMPTQSHGGLPPPSDALPWQPIYKNSILLPLRLNFYKSALLRSMEPLQYSVGIIEDPNRKERVIIKSSTYKAARSPVEPFCKMLCKLTLQNPSQGFQGLLRPSAHQYK